MGVTHNYTYDAVGNITQITKDGAVQESYTYDSLNQLKTVTRGGVTTEYSYQNGNITSVTQNGETVKTYGYTDSTWSDLLTSFNGQTITYDEIGNPLQYRDGMSFTWAKGRQLQSVTKNGVTTSYTYDENGLRLSKTTGGVTTKIYRTNGQMVGMNSSDGKDLMFLLDGSGNVYGLHYDHYSSETQTAAATYYFAYNAQGDVIGIYDASGTVVATYAYDERGNCTVQVLAADSNGHAADSSDHIAQVNPFRYRGYFYDNETGLYYLNSRYYDPETYRFLNADGILGANQDVISYNLFAYCSNDPINFCDELGCGKISNWFKNIGNKIKEWWNSETPSSPITIPSSNSLISSISDAALGAVGKALGQIQKNIPYGSSSRGTIRGTPWQTGPKYPKAIKTVGTVSAIISIASLALDVGNTWTEQNGNTNGDRVIKTTIQFAAVGVGVGVGALAKVAFAGLTAANMPVVGAVAFAAVSVVGGILIDYASNAIYEKAGIK